MKGYYDITSNSLPDPQVRLYQLRLNSIREHYHHNWEKLDPDGIYGPKTKQVVEAFQKYYGLTPVSGKLGPTTASKIVEIDSQGFLSDATANVNPTRGGVMPTELLQIQADEIVSYIASFIDDVSDRATKEACNLINQRNVNHGDVNRIIRSMIDRPNVATMRKEIETRVWDEINNTSRRNTNVGNYKGNKQTLDSLWKIQDAQRQVSLGRLSNQSRSIVNNALYKEVIDRSVRELDNVNIGKRISDALKTPKAGGNLLTAVSLVPLIRHAIELLWRACNHEPVKETIILFVKDIISFVVGILIGLIISAIVTAIGLTGGVAVVAVIVIGIVVSLIISIFFPNWEENAATALVNWIKNTADDIALTSELASGRTYCRPDYYSQTKSLVIENNPYYNPIPYIK